MGTSRRSSPRALRPRLPKAGARKEKRRRKRSRKKPSGGVDAAAREQARPETVADVSEAPSLRRLLPKRVRRKPCRNQFPPLLRQSGLPGGLTSLPRRRQRRPKSRKMPPWSRKSRRQSRPWRVHRQTGNRRPRPKSVAVAVRASPREQNPRSAAEADLLCRCCT